MKQHPRLFDAQPRPLADASVVWALQRFYPLAARALSLIGAVSVGLLPACRSGDVEDRTPAAAPAVVSAGGAATSGPAAGSIAAGGAGPGQPVSADDGKPPFASKPWRIPVGPNLPIVPGKGLGPIRFGAHLDTIERLIGEPCEDKRQDGAKVICRFSAQAVDFVLGGDGVTQMRAHRLGRPFNPGSPLEYGIYNGRFENGVAFGMLDRGVRELLGAPRSVRNVEGDNPNHTVEVHEYDGVTLEFDRISPESVVLGGVIMNAPSGGVPPGAHAPSRGAAASKAARHPKPAHEQRPLH